MASKAPALFQIKRPLPCCCGRDFDLSSLSHGTVAKEFTQAVVIFTEEIGLRYIIQNFRGSRSRPSIASRLNEIPLIIVVDLPVDRVLELGQEMGTELVEDEECTFARILSDPRHTVKAELKKKTACLGLLLNNGSIVASFEDKMLFPVVQGLQEFLKKTN